MEKPEGLKEIIETGFNLVGQYADLVCRLTEKGVCARCLEQAKDCGWCYYNAPPD